MKKALTLEINNKRIVSLDLARALCALWIIGVWHLLSYAGFSVSNHFTRAITTGVLATFIFISGYFMGEKKINNAEDVKNFIAKRMIRFYPLFFISCTTLYICFIFFGSTYIDSFKQYILTLLGLSCIITPAPSTLWFMSMLFLFYMLTPLILFLKEGRQQIFSCIVIYSIMILLYTFIKIDTRLLLYFPIYCFALMTKTKFDFKTPRVPFLIVSIILFIILVTGDFAFSLIGLMEEILTFLYSMCFVVIVTELCMILSKFNVIKKILLPIGFSSMVAYLFHRQIYGILRVFIGVFKPWECIFALILVIVISYFIQSGYDAILKRINDKRPLFGNNV